MPRKTSVGDDHQLVLGSGWYVRVGDWVLSASGEDPVVLGDKVFCKIYEEVDVDGSARPTAAEHEAAAKDFIREFDVLLVGGLRLSREEHANIFRDRDRIFRNLHRLLDDHAYVVARRERQLIRDRLIKEL